MISFIGIAVAELEESAVKKIKVKRLILLGREEKGTLYSFVKVNASVKKGMSYIFDISESQSDKKTKEIKINGFHMSNSKKNKVKQGFVERKLEKEQKNYQKSRISIFMRR